MEAIHRYEGKQGDGLWNHGGSCPAAMLHSGANAGGCELLCCGGSTVSRYSRSSIRIGPNSGEVIVGSVGDGLHGGGVIRRTWLHGWSRWLHRARSWRVPMPTGYCLFFTETPVGPAQSLGLVQGMAIISILHSPMMAQLPSQTASWVVIFLRISASVSFGFTVP